MSWSAAWKWRSARIGRSTFERASGVALKRDDKDTGLTDRTSYVIGKDGRIVMVHSDLDWREHVKLTLQTVQAMKARS